MAIHMNLAVEWDLNWQSTNQSVYSDGISVFVWLTDSLLIVKKCGASCLRNRSALVVNC